MSNHSKSVGEEAGAGVVGSCEIPFIMFFFRLSFVFLLFYILICFYFSVLVRARSSYLDSSICENEVVSGRVQAMEAVKTTVLVLTLGYVFHVGLKAAVGCWIFHIWLRYPVARLCNYDDCLFSIIVKHLVGS